MQAASILRDKIRTIHLSDYVDGNTHVFIGDGTLDFAGLFQALDLSTIYAITLECSIGPLGRNATDLAPTELIDRLKVAKRRLEMWLPRGVLATACEDTA